MSQSKTRSKDAASKGGRRPAEIDLGKDAVTDVTPPTAEAAQADVAAAEVAQPEAAPVVDLPAEAGPAAVEAAAEAPAVVADEAPSEIAPPRVAAAPVKSGGSGLAGGAVAGALFGVLGAFGYGQYLQPMVSGPDPRVVKIETAIAAVERKAGDAGQIEQKLLSQIKVIEGKAAAAELQVQALAKQTAGFEQKLSAPVAVPLAAPAASAPAAETKPGEAAVALGERLKAAEARLSEAVSRGEALAKQVDALAKVEPPKVDIAPLTSKLNDLERLVGTSAARTVLSADTAQAFEGRIKTVEQAAKEADAAAKASTSAVKGLEASVGGLRANRPVETAGAVLSIATLARRSFEQGDAVGAYTTALSALGVKDAVLAPLGGYAQAGAPTPAALAEQFAALAAKLPKPQPATPAAPKSDSLVDRLTSGLLSQVEVKPVGVAARPDATGLAGAIRQKLLAGDWTAAVQMVATLPPEQQAGLKPFVDALHARGAALAAFRTIEGEALAALSRKG